MREHFLLDPEVVFLNHGSFGACPRPVFDEYQRLQAELERHPAKTLDPRGFPALVASARATLADYVGAHADDIVLVTNATLAVNSVFRSLDLEPGDEIVTTTHAYGGNALLLEYVCERAGATCVVVDTWPARAVEDVLAAITPRTRALLVDHISSPTALRFPVEEIVAGARAAGVLTMVDGAHAPSQIPLDVEAVGADFYTGNCHKWLCAPKGSAFLHVRPDAQPLVQPLAISWDWSREAWADRHRWTGTRDPSAQIAVGAAIRFQQEHDWDAVRARCHALTTRALAGLVELGCEALPAGEHEYSQMAAVRLPDCDPFAVGARLLDEHRVEVLAQQWQGRPLLRVSFQAYNDDSDLDALLEALPRALS